ncbi:NUDIX hydrolase [Acidimangrovimonas sediminis]|uniref:NUDIX hydrolase n=1 Tax=Acidimangrovimonas sediminis TaxID=2056283 RepID=UPI001E4C623E|nr:NUDIX hydrolase [Acidimangrovimonas sediminis]
MLPKSAAIAEAKDGGDACTQYGALCWRRAGDGVEVLLVTSRDTGRWVIPKGWPMAGLGPSETARQEAYEEAGVDGKVRDACAGLYSYTKVLGPDRSTGVPCVVAVYPIEVRKLAGKFPEAQERRRKWFSPKKAASKVDEPELGALLLNVARTVASPDNKGSRGRKSG